MTVRIRGPDLFGEGGRKEEALFGRIRFMECMQRKREREREGTSNQVPGEPIPKTFQRSYSGLLASLPRSKDATRGSWPYY